MMLLPFQHSKERSPFPCCVPCNYRVNSESVVGVKPGDSGVVIGCQVDEFTHHGLQSASLLNHTFILVSWARCQH